MNLCRAEEASYYRKEAEEAELRLTEAQTKLRQGFACSYAGLVSALRSTACVGSL